MMAASPSEGSQKSGACITLRERGDILSRAIQARKLNTGAAISAEHDPVTSQLLPLGAAIRRGEDRTVELLLQYQADPQLREHSREVPLLIAIAKGATKCVKILLDHRADPCSTASGHTAAYPGRTSSKVGRKTAMELATPFPEIAALLRLAMEPAHISHH